MLGIVCLCALIVGAGPTTKSHPDISKINDPAMLRSLLTTAYARIDALEAQLAVTPPQTQVGTAPATQPSQSAKVNSWDFVVTALSDTPTDTIEQQIAIEQSKVAIGQGGRGFYNNDDNSLDRRITREQDKLNEMQSAFTQVRTSVSNGRGGSSESVQQVPKYSPAQIQQQRGIVNKLTAEKASTIQHINQLQKDLDKARATMVITGTMDTDKDGTPEESIMVTTTPATFGIARTLYPGQHVRVGGSVTQKSPLQVTATSIVPMDTAVPPVPIRQPK
jgi:hypothetical protein